MMSDDVQNEIYTLDTTQNEIHFRLLFVSFYFIFNKLASCRSIMNTE